LYKGKTPVTSVNLDKTPTTTSKYPPNEATIGIFDGGFEAKANASLGVGGGFGI